MVCQKNPASAHDFSRDPIRPVRCDGWLVADETTLGADNGIGVALILAALEEGSLVHGPLEAHLPHACHNRLHILATSASSVGARGRYLGCENDLSLPLHRTRPGAGCFYSCAGRSWRLSR